MNPIPTAALTVLLSLILAHYTLPQHWALVPIALWAYVALCRCVVRLARRAAVEEERE